MGLEMEVILAYAFGLIILYIIGYALYKVFAKPLKWLGIMLFNGIVGGILLLIVNLIGVLFDFHLAINPMTALTAGFLGIPGILLIIILKSIL